MKHGSLFSGIGGFDLASEWMGWDNVFHCEINPFCQRVLKYYWPNAVSYDDICKTDFTIWRGKIDILTGGFPCQPYSVAGKRKGTEDARHLWPEMLRAIRECRPTWIVGENVPGLINWSKGLVFEQVCASLEGEGYEVQPVILPACSVNAPHKRDRVWIVAYSVNSGNSNRSKGIQKEGEGKRMEYEHAIYKPIQPDNVRKVSSDPKRSGGEREYKQQQEQREFRGCDSRNVASTNGRRQSSKEYRQEESGQPTEKSLSDHWANFPTVAPLFSRDDGIPYRLDNITFPKLRNESIKAYGNAIVPQVVYEIFKAIEQMNDNGKE